MAYQTSSSLSMWVFPKIRGKPPPKWMVYFMENPIRMDDLGAHPYFGNTHVDPFARLKMLHFPTNACLAFRAFKSCNVSPSKFAKKACESRKLWWQFCNFGRDSLQALGMGPFAKGFCLPDLVACRLHTLWSRKNFSSGCGPCSTQALFCLICLHQEFCLQ